MKQGTPSKNNINEEEYLPKFTEINLEKRKRSSKNSKKCFFLGKKSLRGKKENSLELITKKFIKYISNLKTKYIDLNNAVKVINIKKRRIYDITNVLEGKFYYLLK